MVPIHAKRMLWEMRERFYNRYAFLLAAERHLFCLKNEQPGQLVTDCRGIVLNVFL
jgi:hypothetical protein